MGAESAPTSEARSPLGLGVDMSASSGSYELVLSAAILGLFGLWLDRKVGTTPLFIIVFSVLGFFGAVASVFYRYKHQIAQIQAETEALRAEARGDRR